MGEQSRDDGGSTRRKSSAFKALDLTGLRRGDLEFLRRVGKDASGNILWECKCHRCGNLCVIPAYAHKYPSGAYMDCGCRRRERAARAKAEREQIEARKAAKTARDFSGAEFPAFHVVGRHGPPEGINTLWDCICKVCGKPCVIVQRQLHCFKSCGCLLGLAQDDLANRLREYCIDGTMVNVLLSSRKTNKNSTTGARGVSIIKRGNRQIYRAYINLRRKHIGLGWYDNLEDAIAARKAGEDLYYAPIIDAWTQAHGHAPAPRGEYKRATQPSGLPTGVQRSGSRYIARFFVDNRIYKVGAFDTVEAAVQAREKAMEDYKAGRPIQKVPSRTNIDFDMRAARKAAGLTLQRLADMLGVSRTAVGFWEKGRSRPKPETVARIKSILLKDQ